LPRTRRRSCQFRLRWLPQRLRRKSSSDAHGEESPRSARKLRRLPRGFIRRTIRPPLTLPLTRELTSLLPLQRGSPCHIGKAPAISGYPVRERDNALTTRS
jgi:hypothetical protein